MTSILKGVRMQSILDPPFSDQIFPYVPYWYGTCGTEKKLVVGRIKFFHTKYAYFLGIFCDKFCLFVDIQFFLKIIFTSQALHMVEKH